MSKDNRLPPANPRTGAVVSGDSGHPLHVASPNPNGNAPSRSEAVRRWAAGRPRAAAVRLRRALPHVSAGSTRGYDKEPLSRPRGSLRPRRSQGAGGRAGAPVPASRSLAASSRAGRGAAREGGRGQSGGFTRREVPTPAGRGREENATALRASPPRREEPRWGAARVRRAPAGRGAALLPPLLQPRRSAGRAAVRAGERGLLAFPRAGEENSGLWGCRAVPVGSGNFCGGSRRWTRACHSSGGLFWVRSLHKACFATREVLVRLPEVAAAVKSLLPPQIWALSLFISKYVSWMQKEMLNLQVFSVRSWNNYIYSLESEILTEVVWRSACLYVTCKLL